MESPSHEAGAGDAPTLHDKPSRRPKWLLKILVEVAFITVGVFLALMGEQWRERAHARELAHASLERFRTEIVNNRKAIDAEKGYRANLQKTLQQYGTDDPKTRRTENIHIQGLRPVFFEHTAWDLALATQSLADIDPDLAFDLSRIYGLQSRYEDQTRSILQTIYMRPMLESLDSLWYYYNDAVRWDTELLRMSEEVLPKIDRELNN